MFVLLNIPVAVSASELCAVSVHLFCARTILAGFVRSNVTLHKKKQINRLMSRMWISSCEIYIFQIIFERYYLGAKVFLMFCPFCPFSVKTVFCY